MPGLPKASTPLLLGTFTLFLVLFGLVMTLSSSTVYSLQTTGSAYTVFVRQLIWVAIGGGLLAATMSVPYAYWRKLAIPLLVVSVVLLLLVLVPGVGIEVYGSSRWLGA
ncbi:MAG: putative lipid II flippase FtsW, partial [Actinobacteria bacterium ATB1]|nr:putative lipid II flippase FtsW [Actinobacteria bacterium ATB1]